MKRIPEGLVVLCPQSEIARSAPSLFLGEAARTLRIVCPALRQLSLPSREDKYVLRDAHRLTAFNR